MPSTTTNTAATTRAIKLARAAGALSGVAFLAADRTPEQLNAFTAFNAYCVKHSIEPAATYAAAAIADPVKRATKSASGTSTNDDAAKAANEARHAANDAAAKAAHAKANANPEKPSKPSSDDASRAGDYAARVKLIDELRASVASLYNGPSLAVRTNPKRVADSVYSALFDQPKHRTDLSRISARDESALFLALKRGERNGSFDPVHLNLDAGIFSRLRSVGFIQRDGNVYSLTADALAHARKAAKRAA
jgi:hypothetical protein